MPELLAFGAQVLQFGSLTLSQNRVTGIAIIGFDRALSATDSFRVYVADQTLNFAYTNLLRTLVWQYYEFTFTALSSTSTLAFASADPDTADFAFIDNVSVTLKPLTLSVDLYPGITIIDGTVGDNKSDPVRHQPRGYELADPHQPGPPAVPLPTLRPNTCPGPPALLPSCTTSLACSRTRLLATCAPPIAAIRKNSPPHSIKETVRK